VISPIAPSHEFVWSSHDSIADNVAVIPTTTFSFLPLLLSALKHSSDSSASVATADFSIKFWLPLLYLLLVSGHRRKPGGVGQNHHIRCRYCGFISFKTCRISSPLVLDTLEASIIFPWFNLWHCLVDSRKASAIAKTSLIGAVSIALKYRFAFPTTTANNCQGSAHSPVRRSSRTTI